MNAAVKVDMSDTLAERTHVPVMVAEVCALLAGRRPRTIVDATVGTGGHAEALLTATDARLIGLDRDPAAIAAARDRLGRFGARVSLHHADFATIDALLNLTGDDLVDCIIADLGMSSLALDDPSRGFSFRFDGPLDMRMNPEQALTAADIVNRESEVELARILYEYGEERASRRIARAIVNARGRSPISTTGELRLIAERVLGRRRRGGVNPATRTFQALRIAVNRELESLATLLDRAPMRLAAGGRMAVLAYHSLEDRAVKNRLRELAGTAEFILPVRKAIRPSGAEIAQNPRARSARLRCVERMAP